MVVLVAVGDWNKHPMWNGECTIVTDTLSAGSRRCSVGGSRVVAEDTYRESSVGTGLKEEDGKAGEEEEEEEDGVENRRRLVLLL